MRDIGQQIKILREKKSMSGKELAENIGLSQSQMSRLEKGQRRIDTKILNRIAKALEVNASYFFGEDETAESELDLRKADMEIGKIIRKRRHEKHMTPEELGKKVHKTKTYIQEIENGKAQLLTNELVQRICKVLKIDPWEFFKVQQDGLRELKKHVVTLSSEKLEDASRESAAKFASGATAEVGHGEVPIFENVNGQYPASFTNEGLPQGRPSGKVHITGVDGGPAFAIRCIGDSMVQPQAPSFKDGDLLVFSGGKEVENEDFAFLRIVGEKPVFRQVFFDPDNRIRLQPLNRSQPPAFLSMDDVLQWYRLVAHIERY